MPMKNPPHPGKHVRINCIEASDLSVKAGAAMLGVNRNTLSRLVNEQAALSPEMAIRLEKMGWGDADSWMRLQMNYDLAQVRARENEIVVHGAAGPV